MLEDGMVYVFYFKKNLRRVLDVYGKGTEKEQMFKYAIIIIEKIKNFWP